MIVLYKVTALLWYPVSTAIYKDGLRDLIVKFDSLDRYKNNNNNNNNNNANRR